MSFTTHEGTPAGPQDDGSDPRTTASPTQPGAERVFAADSDSGIATQMTVDDALSRQGEPYTLLAPANSPATTQDTTPSKPRRSRRALLALGTTAAVIVAGGIGAAVELGGSNNAKPKATHSAGPVPGKKVHSNQQTETAPSIATFGPTGINLTEIAPGCSYLGYGGFENLPKIPVCRQDPSKDPAATMNSLLAQSSYFLTTSDNQKAAETLGEITDNPTNAAELQSLRNSWQNTSSGKELWFTADPSDPAVFKSHNNPDGTVTVYLASGTIHYAVADANPDQDGWVEPASLANVQPTYEIKNFEATFSKWETRHTGEQALGVRRNLLSSTIKGHAEQSLGHVTIPVPYSSGGFTPPTPK